MRHHRIYINAELLTGANLVLNKESSHYIQTVLRVKSGHQIRVFNGDGNEYNAITTINRKTCAIEIQDLYRTEAQKTTSIHLIQAIARNEHMDFAIQKATELDVDIITPVIASRTQNHDKTRLEKRFTHWQNIIIHACEQSGRCYLPTLNSISTYNQAIETSSGDSKFICQPGEKLKQTLNKEKNIVILVGPEGGFNDEEIDLALNNHYIPLSLGKNILRTETAATSALSIIDYLLD